MGKISIYLKRFFLLEPDTAYEVADYRDYSGAGFSKFKASKYFTVKPSLHNNLSVSKAEAAGYSEMTKLALMTGIIILAAIIVYFDYSVIKILVSSDGIGGAIAFAGYFGIVVLNVLLPGLLPRFIFLLKNFKDPNG